ncbi:hypothetical protein ACGH7X_01830 [Streptomyces sp. BBFR51]|uniref:hypothetical protein n=1 Tax=Streptomyces sp. BBFR51 TaxID=3372856 RepID=UPI0037DCAD92
MTAGWCFRTTRAAVFAAVCVLLATLGHVLMSGTPVAWWALVAAVAVTGGAAWCLAGRERGLLLVSGAMVAAQAALHQWFSYAQELSTPSASATPSMPAMVMGDTAAMAHTGHAMPAMDPASAMDSVSAMGSPSGGGHTGGGMSSTGMLAAHLLAALLCGLWLAYGERAAFRVLRAVAGRLAAPLRLILTLPAPPDRPRVVARRGRAARRPSRPFLVYAITYRGPPAETAVA